MATERKCDACGAGCFWRRKRCRRCAQLLCVFCAAADCAGGHRGNEVVMRAVNLLVPGPSVSP